MSHAADLTVIIVNWNTRDSLRRCLESLPTATPDLTTQIMVVDNASADGSVPLVRECFAQIEVIESGGNLGFARAVNLALPGATGRAVVLLNPDTECPAGSLSRLANRLRERTDAAAVGPILRDGKGQITASYGDFPRCWHHLASCLDPGRSWLPHRWREAGLGRVPSEPRRGAGRNADTANCTRVDYVKGACLMIERAALADIGLLDERYFIYFEETDWCLRAQQAGYSVYLCDDVEVIHFEAEATRQVHTFSEAQFQLSYRLFVEKHRGPGAVVWTRLLQAWEYGWKSLLRRLAPGDRRRNRQLAELYAHRARLQFRNKLAPAPPTTPG